MLRHRRRLLMQRSMLDSKLQMQSSMQRRKKQRQLEKWLRHEDST
uniref:Uncharacterized protein n=1 Tax=Rhizophora mucronata TaxID=61149 RepID=A0A2P2P791_RHIMU